jgi:hypothetical protein
LKLESLVQSLADAGASFILIGGWAAILNGSFAVALALFEPRLRDIPYGLPFVWDDAVLLDATVCTLMTKAGAIDLLAEVAGLGGYEDVQASSILVHAFNRDIRTLDLRGLIRAKRAAGRQKDLDALPEIETLLEASED